MPAKPDHSRLRRRLASVSTGPGIYRWLDEEGNVLYVGKAKNVKHRLSSYLQGGKAHSAWIEIMISQIADFDVTVVGTELEAIMLETNLIKELRPKYNIMMRDDKNYVYARITVKDPYPRIDIVRRMEDDGSLYFGPKTSAEQVRASLNFLRTLFPFRTCKMSIEPASSRELRTSSDADSARSSSSRVVIDVVCHDRDRPIPCIDHHIKQCVAPCIGTVTPKQYRKQCIDGVIAFFQGKYSEVEERLKNEMQEAAKNRRFERAAEKRDQLAKIHALQEKQIVSSTSRANSDVIGAAVLSGRAHVVVMQERDGKLVSEESFALQGKSDSAQEILSEFLPLYYSEAADLPDTIIVGEAPEGQEALERWLKNLRGKNVKLHVPERGKKSRLLKLAEKNADNKARQMEAKWESEERKTSDALGELQSLLNLPAAPRRIEGYDISHQGGEETVGSMVVFENGKPKRDHYRSFNIRTVKHGNVDDYQALAETLRRRLRYLVQNLAKEEARWNEREITFGRARKDEQGRIAELLTPDGQRVVHGEIDYREFLVARCGEETIGSGRLHAHGGGIVSLDALWINESERLQGLADFIARKLLRRVTKGRIYAAIRPNLESTYAELGFRYVVNVSDTLREKLCPPEDSECTVVVYDAHKNKVDDSFASIPDLILLDGGKGQLSTGVSVLEELKVEIPIAGLAKREEEIFLPGASDPVDVAKESAARFLLQRLRDEAHRFANDRRKRRGGRTTFQSALDEVEGIGEELKAKLLKKFGSVDGVRMATDEELRTVLDDHQIEAVRRQVS